MGQFLFTTHTDYNKHRISVSFALVACHTTYFQHIARIYASWSGATAPRPALTALRTFLAFRRRFWLPRVGRVATRRFGATSALRINSVSL
jgi:hypothetical protein